MKKFLLSLVIAIAAISIGLTIYYFSIDNEVIMIKASYLVVEKGDTISTDSLLDFKYRDKNTKLTFGILQDQDNQVLSFNSGDQYYVANQGGESKIEITTTNRSFSKFIINVVVCDGSQEYPYIISSAEALAKIGRDSSNKYLASSHYKLGNDIIFEANEQGNWTPMPSFSGSFDGNYYTISNLHITNSNLSVGATDVGFISKIEQSGVVKNLHLDNINIDVSNVSNVGSVAGTSQGKVQSVEVVGSIKNTNNVACYVGGIVGKNDCVEVRPKVDRCGFEGKIELLASTNVQVAGGVVGYNKSGVVSECYYRTGLDKFVENNLNSFGGIVGLNEGNAKTSDIYDSYFYVQNFNQNTNYAQIGGVVYKNINDVGTNVVIGNYYFGGVTEGSEGQMVSKVVNGSQVVGAISGRYNGFLTASEFTNKEEGSTKFITLISDDLQKRYWDFISVWQMGEKYPLLNMLSASGSVYPTDYSSLVGDNDILTAQDLYNALSNNSADASYNVLGQSSGTSFVIDFTEQDWVWGDASHPIPTTFAGTITSSNGCVIKGLRIVNNTEIEGTNVVNVGLVGTLSSSAIVTGLKFEDITISGYKATNVGVLCGYNDGANISNISFENISVILEGGTFGTVAGYSANRQDRYIQNIAVNKLDLSNTYFVCAGGVVGKNYGVITINKVGTGFKYNTINNAKIYANSVGGVVGINYGNISYFDVNEVNFDALDSTKKVYSNNKPIVAGSIAGLNYSNISDVYGNIIAKANSGKDYQVHIGGIVGYNLGNINRAFSSGCNIQVNDNYSVYAGGLVGTNNAGKISRSVVNKGAIVLSTVLTNSSLTSGTASYPIAGGLVGYDAKTSADYSITECVSLIDSITGAYAGGLIGLSFGKVTKSHSGSQAKQVAITGYVAGGLCATISGKVKDCYTVCKLSGIYTDNSYVNSKSILELKVSSIAGLAVVALTGSEVSGCYTVAEFKDGGVRLSTFTDLESVGYKGGDIKGCVYVTQGQNGQNKYCSLISIYNLTGKSDNYLLFFSKIGSENNSVWSIKDGGYPKLYNVDENLPKARI